MKNSKTLEMGVGLFVLIGLCTLFWMALRVSNMQQSGSATGYTVTASFDNIGSLKVKAPVTLAGVRIGRVLQIQLNQTTMQADVLLRLDAQIELPVDTSASILTAGLVGEQYIGLEVGGADKILRQGDRFKLTQPAMVLERLIGRFLTSMGDKSE